MIKVSLSFGKRNMTKKKEIVFKFAKRLFLDKKWYFRKSSQ